MGRNPSPLSKAERQRQATQKYMNQPDVKERTNAKARVRSASLDLQKSGELASIPSARACARRINVPDHTTSPSAPVDPIDITDFDMVLRAFKAWTYDWGPEESWLRKQWLLISRTLSAGESVSELHEDWRAHAQSGWAIMNALRHLVDIASKECSGSSSYNTQLFDIAAALVSEIRFFEREDSRRILLEDGSLF
ncbi:hypothetical protein CONPUDRAFT_73224 [Coniophora puteana RWD-64-598 SS2]|uniref:Uncharacterized protein n=1 Tax=Coniophora puteana (strain RWD-64-598) TaxID=741705 RepID=A0A5M3MRZ2_CONPW|nr:uncharacterized protein CONPUDRAFT_73224 [Coniophora puteana RWD-64-598 SS2]EIW81514.1 hypothetical protein CONPUDRAFT_73224 [Coniophora puteana RWD-64-598 SS2]